MPGTVVSSFIGKIKKTGRGVRKCSHYYGECYDAKSHKDADGDQIQCKVDKDALKRNQKLSKQGHEQKKSYEI